MGITAPASSGFPPVTKDPASLGLPRAKKAPASLFGAGLATSGYNRKDSRETRPYTPWENGR